MLWDPCHWFPQFYIVGWYFLRQTIIGLILPEYLLKLEFKDLDMIFGLHARYNIIVFDLDINGYGHIEDTNQHL
jgi:hypothetical protein